MRTDRRKRGFTLIELLVTLGIIALLVILGFPALTKGIENAKTAKCQSNQKQIYLAMSAFNGENGRLPQIQKEILAPGTALVAANEPFWNQQLNPYFGRAVTDPLPPEFQCPAESLAANGRGDFGINYKDITPYGIIRNSAPSASLANMIVPLSKAILMADAQQLNGGKMIGTWYFVNEAFANASGNNTFAPRHMGGANVTFADGHCEWGTSTNLYTQYMPYK